MAVIQYLWHEANFFYKNLKKSKPCGFRYDLCERGLRWARFLFVEKVGCGMKFRRYFLFDCLVIILIIYNDHCGLYQELKVGVLNRDLSLVHRQETCRIRRKW